VETSDALRETVPFIVGTLLPGAVLLMARQSWNGLGRFMCVLVSSLILGVCTSALAGELRPELDSLLFVMIDASLVLTGSQVAYWLAWKPAVARVRRARDASVRVTATES
jgi:hypothetical protein